MPGILIEEGDARLGRHGDGVWEWPALDVHGQPYERINATTLRVDATHFVVIGPNRGQHIEVVAIVPHPTIQESAVEEAAPDTQPIAPAETEPPFEVDEIDADSQA